MSLHKVNNLSDSSQKVLFNSISTVLVSHGEPVVNTLRDYLDQLITHRIRSQLWEQYCNTQEDLPELELFLDVILDPNFKTLKTGNYIIASPEFQPSSLVEVISRQCSTLHHLSLGTIAVMPCWMPPNLSPESALASSLSNFTQLLTLELGWLPSSAVELLSNLGTSCPHLKSLKLNLNPMGLVTEQQLALILGNRADLFPHNDFGPKTLHRIQFHPEHQTPICQTLRHFTSNCIFVDCQVVALLLRHLPQITNLQLPSCSYMISQAIEMLYSLSESTTSYKWEINREEEPGDLSCLKFTENSILRNNLNLQILPGSTNLRNRKMLTAVDSMCPDLKSIQFSSFKSENNHLRPAQLHNFLSNRFSELTTVALNSIPLNYRKGLFSSIGPQLSAIKLMRCPAFDLEELLPCSELEELVIKNGCQFPTTRSPEAETLLRRLKTLQIECCLAQCSLLFECEMPSLTNLQLHCAHFGIPGASNFRWDNIPSLWPNVKNLKLSSLPPNMTVDAIHLITQRIPNLKSIELPIRIAWPQSELTYNVQTRNGVVDKFRDSSIDVTFDYTTTTKCVYDE